MDSHIRTPVVAIQAAVAGAAEQTSAGFVQRRFSHEPLDNLGKRVWRLLTVQC
jgi:hypothetical protein